MKTENLTFDEALRALTEGKKVRVPEWTGYWFREGEETKVFTRNGDILDTPHYSKYATRTDWQVTEGNMGFDFAILALKNGKKVARKGWNGKNMYLWLLPEAKVQKSWVKDPMLLSVLGDREELRCLGSIRMLTATGEVLTGWLASQSDMLAEDWVLVP